MLVSVAELYTHPACIIPAYRDLTVKAIFGPKIIIGPKVTPLIGGFDKLRKQWSA